MGLAENLKTWRDRRGYDQSELARAVGVAPTTIWRIENKGGKPRGATLRKIAEVLKIDVVDLTSTTGATAHSAAPTPETGDDN